MVVADAFILSDIQKDHMHFYAVGLIPHALHFLVLKMFFSSPPYPV